MASNIKDSDATSASTPGTNALMLKQDVRDCCGRADRDGWQMVDAASADDEIDARVDALLHEPPTFTHGPSFY